MANVSANRGCSRTIDGKSYGFCSNCDYLSEANPHGVQSAKAGEDGCKWFDLAQGTAATPPGPKPPRAQTSPGPVVFKNSYEGCVDDHRFLTFAVSK